VLRDEHVVTEEHVVHGPVEPGRPRGTARSIAAYLELSRTAGLPSEESHRLLPRLIYG
jgi:hypothetical protein